MAACLASMSLRIISCNSIMVAGTAEGTQGELCSKTPAFNIWLRLGRVRVATRHQHLHAWFLQPTPTEPWAGMLIKPISTAFDRKIGDKSPAPPIRPVPNNIKP